mmetsp:Transcript_5604/g.5798  ORF Transcript_5604/g.5798 Transcript_5604/m.5798 type:complete len:219 (+) Transcript_5604:117-773(+)
MAGVWVILGRILIGVGILVALMLVWYFVGFLLSELWKRSILRRNRNSSSTSTQIHASQSNLDVQNEVNDTRFETTLAYHHRNTTNRKCSCLVSKEELNSICPSFEYKVHEEMNDEENPKLNVDKEEPNADLIESDSCAICLDDIEYGNTLKKLPCLHQFHAKCISKWVRRTNRCPLCNQLVINPDTHTAFDKSTEHFQQNPSVTQRTADEFNGVYMFM